MNSKRNTAQKIFVLLLSRYDNKKKGGICRLKWPCTTDDKNLCLKAFMLSGFTEI